MEKESDQHRRTRRLRPDQDPGHRLVRPCHDSAAQADQGVLRHEDTGQAEGGEAEAGGAHPEREEDTAGDQLPVPGITAVSLQGQLVPLHGA